MKKMLLFNTFELKSSGGPAGYLYNIREYIEKEKIDSIDFADLYEKKINKEILWEQEI